MIDNKFGFILQSLTQTVAARHTRKLMGGSLRIHRTGFKLAYISRFSLLLILATAAVAQQPPAAQPQPPEPARQDPSAVATPTLAQDETTATDPGARTEYGGPAAYALRLTSNHQAKARLLQLSLSGLDQARAQAQARDFVHHYLPGQWRSWALQQLVQHRRQGHRCVIISASPGIYLHLVGDSLGVDAVLCTEMEVQNGRYTGRMATPNCHGEEKVHRLRVWLRETQRDGIMPELYAYGDSRGDLPLLEMADHAWYRGKRWLRS